MRRRRRRQFLIGAATLVAAPRLGAQAVARRVRIAILEDSRVDLDAARWKAFRGRLAELGYLEGKNLVIQARSSQGRLELLSALAAELVALAPDAIVVATTPSARAAMKATSSIPIIFTAVAEPVETGLVASLARPGRNLTGTTIMSGEISAKWLEFLTQIVPGAKKVAYLGHATNQAVLAVYRSMQRAAGALNLAVRLMEAADSAAVERAFRGMVAEKFDGFVVAGAPTLLAQQQQIIDLAARHRLPGVYARDEYVAAGGLLSYSPDRNALYRRGADYVHRTLQGASPSDLPVEEPTVFELTVNLKTAKAMGIRMPQSILLLAQRIIE